MQAGFTTVAEITQKIRMPATIGEELGIDLRCVKTRHRPGVEPESTGGSTVANNGAYSYNDFKIGVTKDFGFASVSLAAIGADTDAYFSPVNGKDLAKTGAVLTISKTF